MFVLLKEMFVLMQGLFLLMLGNARESGALIPLWNSSLLRPTRRR